MQGYLITFFTQQDRRHRGHLVAQWLVQLARDMGLPGVTTIACGEGFGHHRRIHSAHFFELGDLPQEVQMAVSADDATRLFAKLKLEGLDIFYIKTPVEFGSHGGMTDD
ncbi:DUF190 domain-containing protein [Niveibacterium sp.]|uniref:DUF190 domain-containing protein n=1 Tax=Niveibacterium sp. TaxID=2017444 RepID=UPI0035B14C3E